MKKLPKAATLLGFFDPPHHGQSARERLDLALALAAADWPLTVVFAGPGVLLLKSRQTFDEIRDFPAALATLELFGVAEIYAEEAALTRYAIDTDDTRIAVRALAPADFRRLMGSQACLS